jgi:hypothetical protein
MTAYIYGYNVNNVLASSTKILSTKQTNVYNSDDLELGQQKCGSTLLKRDNVQGIMKKNLWPVHLE